MSGKVARGIRKFAAKQTVGVSKVQTRVYYKSLKSFYTSNHSELMNFKRST